MKISLPFVGLLGARGAKLAVGLATMFVYARMFGISVTYDAWVWSLGMVNAANLMLFGPISETIRASYSAIEKQEGKPAAEQYLATVAMIMIGVACLAAIVAISILPVVTTMLIDRHTIHGSQAAFFLQALMPSLVISQLVTVLTAYLNCRGRIYPPEVAGIVGGAIGVSFVILFPRLPATWLLIGSYYIGLVSPLVIGASFWPELFRTIGRVDLLAFRRYARESLVFSLPLFLPYALGQVCGVIERQFALQTGVGTLAVLSYAMFARNTVQAVFTAALFVLVVPALARAWNADDRHPFHEALHHWTRQCLLLATIGMAVLFGLSDLFPPILFGSNIQAEPQLLLGELLRYYAIAIIAVVLYLLGGATLLAARKGKTYALFGALACVLLIILLVILFPIIGVIAMPIALALSHLLAAWLMFYAINRRGSAWIVLQTALCLVIVVLAGWTINFIDGAAHHAAVPLAGRLALGLCVAMVPGALWWAFRWRKLRSNPLPRIGGEA